MINRRDIFFGVALFYIIYITFPLFELIIPIKTLSICTLSIILFLYPTVFLTKSMLWTLIYLFLLFCYAIFERPVTVGVGIMSGFQSVILESAFLLPPIAILGVLSTIDDRMFLKRFGRSIALVLLVSVVFVIISLKANPYILREAHTEQLYIPGLPQYTLMHAYIIMLPQFFYAYIGKSNIARLFITILLFSYLYLLYSTYITTLLLLVVGVVVASLIYAYRTKPIFWLIILSLLIIAISVNENVVISFFDKLIDLYYGTAVQEKIEDFKWSFINGRLNGDTIEGRMSYHDVSWNSFYKNVFIGGGEYGRHSSLIDRLGGMGILVFFPYCMIIITSIKTMLHRFIDKSMRFYFGTSVFCVFVILYNKGLFGVQGWLFFLVLMPIVSFWLQEMKVIPNERKLTKL